MKFQDALIYLSNTTPAEFYREINKLEIEEIERYVRKLNGIQIYLEQIRDKKLKEPTATEEIFNVQESASYLKVTTQTIYNLIERGEIKSSRVGRAIRIPISELKKYLNKRNS